MRAENKTQPFFLNDYFNYRVPDKSCHSFPSDRLYDAMNVSRSMTSSHGIAKKKTSNCLRSRVRSREERDK